MDNIGEEKRVPVIGIRMAEVHFVVGLGFLGLMVAQSVPVEQLSGPILLGTPLLGILVVYASPSHMTTTKWLASSWRYVKRPTVTFAASESAPGDQKNQGGLANATPFEPDERTQELTHVERAWPDRGAILRTDGVVEAFVELEADNMDFATADDWASRQRAATEYLNKGLEKDLKFHATTESFDIQSVVERLEERLSDPDVKERPTLRVLLEEYREKRPREMRDRGTQQVRYYLGVSVRESEIAESTQFEKTPAEKLGRLPVLGLLFSPFVTRSDDLTEAEVYERLTDRLDQRINDARNNFLQNATGFRARRLSTVELFALNARFWNGRAGVAEETLADAIAGSTVVDRSPREDEGR